MLRISISLLLMFVGSVAYAQDEDVRSRALAACQDQHDAYTQVAECLPGATVAITALDSFDDLFSGDAAKLKSTCLDINDDIASAELCIRNALKNAQELIDMLPEGSTIKDPVFAAVADPDKIKAYNAKIDEARSQFPDVRMWGFGTYYPYK